MALDFGLTNGLFTNSDLLSTNSKMWTCSGLAFNGTNAYGGDPIAYTHPHYADDTTNFSCSTCLYPFVVCALPDGVTIDGFVVYSSDTAALSDLNYVRLYRVSLTDGSEELLGTDKYNVDINVSSKEVVDNSAYSYVILCALDYGFIYGAKVTYSL